MPTMQDVHIDAALSDFAFGVLQDNKNHVAGGFFPIEPVDQLSNKYYTLPRNLFSRGDARARKGNEESAGFDFDLSTDNYNCIPYGMHTDVDLRKLANADNRRLYEQAATRLVVDNLLLTHEIAWAADFFATSKWGTDYTGVASAPTGNQFLQWNDANSDPEKDVDKASRGIIVNGGRKPNKMLVGYDVFLALKKHPKFVDRIKYTSSDPVTAQLIAKLLGLDALIVAMSTKATNAVGAAETYDFVHGKAALLAHVSESGDGELVPSAGRIFAWNEVNPGSLKSRTIAVSRIPKPLHKAERYEAEVNWGHKVTGSQLGAFFATAVA